MKLKHTQAKKARRASAFRSMGAKDTPWGSRFEERATLGASKRKLKRNHLQQKTPKTFGLQIARTQRIFLKKDRFGAPVYRTIFHAAVPKAAPEMV